MKTVIFGCGFTGTQLSKFLPEALCTELPELCSESQIPFDFKDIETWKNIPHFDQAVVTFKMTDTGLAKQFSKLLEGKKTIILSSARNFSNSEINELISEKNPLKSNPRSMAEAQFTNQAVTLYLGLIWGYSRNPAKWISEGRIKNGEKLINLIHVDDLCKIILYFLNHYQQGESFLVSDGKPLKWSEIAMKSNFNLKSQEPGLESRQFNTAKLLGTLPKDFQFHKP